MTNGPDYDKFVDMIHYVVSNIFRLGPFYARTILPQLVSWLDDKNWYISDRVTGIFINLIAWPIENSNKPVWIDLFELNDQDVSSIFSLIKHGFLYNKNRDVFTGKTSEVIINWIDSKKQELHLVNLIRLLHNDPRTTKVIQWILKKRPNFVF
jgi:hypothetical protein